MGWLLEIPLWQLCGIGQGCTDLLVHCGKALWFCLGAMPLARLPTPPCGLSAMAIIWGPRPGIDADLLPPITYLHLLDRHLNLEQA